MAVPVPKPRQTMRVALCAWEIGRAESGFGAQVGGLGVVVEQLPPALVQAADRMGIDLEVVTLSPCFAHYDRSPPVSPSATGLRRLHEHYTATVEGHTFDVELYETTFTETLDLTAGRREVPFKMVYFWDDGQLHWTGSQTIYPDDPSVSSAVGLGDISTRALFRVWQSPHFSAVVGTELTFPTATDPLLGTQKYSVSPLAALVFQYRNFFFVPVYQQVISYAGNVDRNKINIIRFRPVLLAAWPRGWWTTLEPGLWWDLEDAFLTEDTATLGFEVGKRITERLAFSGKPSVRLNGSEEFAWSLDFSLSYVWE